MKGYIMTLRKLKKIIEEKITSARESHEAKRLLLNKMSALDEEYASTLLDFYTIEGELMAYFDILYLINRGK